MKFSRKTYKQLREMAVDFTEQDSKNFYKYYYSHGPGGILTIPAGKRLVIHFSYEDDPLNADLLQQAFDTGREVERRTAGFGELEY